MNKLPGRRDSCGSSAFSFRFFAEETGSRQSQTIKNIKLAILAVSNLSKVLKVWGVTLFLSLYTGINGISAAVAVLNIFMLHKACGPLPDIDFDKFCSMRMTFAQLA